MLKFQGKGLLQTEYGGHKVQCFVLLIFFFQHVVPSWLIQPEKQYKYDFKEMCPN